MKSSIAPPGSSINAAIFDARHDQTGVYLTAVGIHYLFNSILLDNCGAIYIVNDISLLDDHRYKPSNPNDIVEAGTLSFQALGRGVRMIKRIIQREGHPNSDLILNDVALIPGFHVNIVSEARLEKAGL
ncbi:hypothetical protein OCU04_012675 [Sclerotinia nivalis]|uniref:Uncharacterized protein n=1 Tax=Sclerotinia nivalis TaxID=352851 RepID=A0A9X0DEC8_9HELO|nr:hypothetical protein OCU04_012675 [Sclerotinia nivalis]